eukprot:scaffold71841_cov76-Phaeocystis_antarctica.AAC.2
MVPATSEPAALMPGLPGYSPSTMSTSRKLRPAAWTRTSTSPSASAALNAGCWATCRLETAPESGSSSRIGRQMGVGFMTSRLTSQVSPRTNTSGSVVAVSCNPRTAPHSYRNSPAQMAFARPEATEAPGPAPIQKSGSAGISARTARARPQSPACQQASPLTDAGAPEVTSHMGTGGSCEALSCTTESAATNLGSGLHPDATKTRCDWRPATDNRSAAGGDQTWTGALCSTRAVAVLCDGRWLESGDHSVS